jgi:hypothetical protein
MSESEYERRQREMAQRILSNAMPDFSRIWRDLKLIKPRIVNIGKLYTPTYQKMMSEISRDLPKVDALAASSLLKFNNLDIPALKLDYSALFPRFSAIDTQALAKLTPSIQLIQDLQRNQFADIIATAGKAAAAILPPNWRGSGISIPSDLDVLLLDEGLALAWVPPSDAVFRLFAASSQAERRKILGNCWRRIARACVDELNEISDPALEEHVEFALEAAETLLDGRSKPAQALSANLLDTILRQSFNQQDRTSITGRKQRFDIDEYPVRVAIVLGGIWGSYGEFWTDKGDKIPREYSRHGTAHGVSRRQYSRINSLLALMHVVSLLRLIENDLS